jgi:hypothetical protein
VAIQGAANLFSDYFDYRGGYELSILRERRRARSRHPPAQSVHRAFGLLRVIGVLLPVA